MVKKEDAYRIANEYISTMKINDEIKLMDRSTREEDFGWVFCYNTKAFADFGDASVLLGGNAPIIIDRYSGELIVTGSRLSINDYIILYRKYRGNSKLFKEACLKYIPGNNSD